MKSATELKCGVCGGSGMVCSECGSAFKVPSDRRFCPAAVGKHVWAKCPACNSAGVQPRKREPEDPKITISGPGMEPIETTVSGMRTKAVRAKLRRSIRGERTS